MKIYSSSLGNIHSGLIANGLPEILEDLKPSAVFIIADENTAQLCVPKLGADYPVITLPAGEHHKNLSSCQVIWSSLITHGADRNSVVLNVGGGMICDLGGFAASCYQRGIRFGHIPTTVLSIADAALGGKTGIDYEGLKNYIGLIQVPAFIWVDETFLNTLPRLEKISGLAEIVKHAIIGSEDLWDTLSETDSVDDIPWEAVFRKNFPVKLNIVEADLTEKGLRKVLNFGHTVGHALESYYLKSDHPLTHGQCVTLGMLMESKISNMLGLLNNEDFETIVTRIDVLLDPVRISLPTFELLNTWLNLDKKKSGARIGFSLPDRIGSCKWNIPVEDQVIKDCLSWLSQAMDVPVRFELDN